MTAIDLDHLRQWIGRSQTAQEELTPALLDRFHATMDSERPPAKVGDEAPQPIHWCLTAQIARASEIGPDGHGQKGGFMPPIPLPRRMWAGSKIEFLAPMRAGDLVTRRSTIAALDVKQGRTGVLAFLKIVHEYETSRGLALREALDAVYREADSRTQTPPKPVAASEAETAQWRRTIDPSPVLLFRYSALTFNSHRIHYDRPYACEVEHYPGLLVHGPLQATLLLLLAREAKGEALRNATLRAEAPLFDGPPFEIAARRAPEAISAWTQAENGLVSMRLTAD